jgi:hypothetical protein
LKMETWLTFGHSVKKTWDIGLGTWDYVPIRVFRMLKNKYGSHGKPKQLDKEQAYSLRAITQ